MSIDDWSCVRSIPPQTIVNRGFFPSSKVEGGIVAYASQLERDLFILLDHDPAVKRFQHQPQKIKYKNLKGRNSKYTPDVKIEFKNGLRVLIEVKYQNDILKKKTLKIINQNLHL